MNKNFLDEQQITEKVLINCLSQISLFSNRTKKLYSKEPFFTWELLGQDILERIVWLYNHSEVNIKTGEILKINPELNIKIPKNVEKLHIALSHKEKSKSHISLEMHALCLKENEWYTTINNNNDRMSGILLEKEGFCFDNTISIDLKNIASPITSILFCACLTGNRYTGSDLSSLDFDITQITTKTKKKSTKTFSLINQIKDSYGVIAFELIRQDDWWKIEMVKEKLDITVDELVDSYDDYLPFR